ncbi:DgyrCDS12544 [Dimorphilus gyrociliatus]|uniref:DgyrCDS12544 n=1 Tax=Dimorphilus gyrociliatus TaxID=2664684 RepID=A0A7I8W8L5_9ANNE|nr:DgyrCDS12544 [Dimorphilus gyrociliatus]
MDVWIVYFFLFKIFFISEATIYKPGAGCFCNLQSTDSIKVLKNPQMLFIECLWPYLTFEKQLEMLGPDVVNKGEIERIRDGYGAEEKDFQKVKKCEFNQNNRTLLGLDIRCVESEIYTLNKSSEQPDHLLVKNLIKPSKVTNAMYCRNSPPIAINDCKSDTLSTVNLEMNILSVPYFKIYRSTSALCNANFKTVCYLEVITSDDDTGVNYSVDQLFNGQKCKVKPKIEVVKIAIFYFTGYDQLTGKLPFIVSEQLELSSLIFKNATINQLSEIESYLTDTPGKLIIQASCDCHALWLLNVYQVRARKGYSKRLDTLKFCRGHELEGGSLLKLTLRYFNEIEPEMPSNPKLKFAWEISRMVNSVKNIDFKSNCTDLYQLYNNVSAVCQNYTAMFLIILLTTLNYF